jgi:hypothetical protein
MSEARANTYIMDLLSPDVDFTRIESRASAPGVPDIYYNAKGLTGWIEDKYAPSITHHDVNKGLKKLRPAQVNWMVREAKTGARAFIFLRTDQAIYVFDGINARELRNCQQGSLPGKAVFTTYNPKADRNLILNLLRS